VHDVKIALHPEVAVTVKVNVARSPEEAELQAQGVDVMAEMFERDSAELAEELEPGAETEEAAPGEVAAEVPAAEEAAADEAPAAEAAADEADAEDA
jgi:large subunit ribosomal protein L9